MGLKGRDRNDDLSDAASEREALRRQRLEAANELASLKLDLSERVAQVQQRERELADALARVEKREQKLDAADQRGSRLDSLRLRLAEAKEARASLDQRREELDAREQQLTAREAALAAGAADHAVSPPPPPDPAVADELDARAASLDARGETLDVREAELTESMDALTARESELDERAAELDARAAELAAREQAAEETEQAVPALAAAPDPTPAADELERIEAKLAELREAEQAFVRTQHELAARSDALTEQEAALASASARSRRRTPLPHRPSSSSSRRESAGSSRAAAVAPTRRRPSAPDCAPCSSGVSAPTASRTSLYTDSLPGALAQLGERRLCKAEVAGSIPARSITPGRSALAGDRLPGSDQRMRRNRVPDDPAGAELDDGGLRVLAEERDERARAETKTLPTEPVVNRSTNFAGGLPHPKPGMPARWGEDHPAADAEPGELRSSRRLDQSFGSTTRRNVAPPCGSCSRRRRCGRPAAPPPSAPSLSRSS